VLSIKIENYNYNSDKQDQILVDAFYISAFPKDIQHPIIGGDRMCSSIAAASIIAKVYRDELMEKLDNEFPGYDFAVHKGYGTKAHQQAIKQKGLSPLHQKHQKTLQALNNHLTIHLL
jgi:ribonuclease HII